MGVSCSADRVAHVVETVEEAHEVEADAVVVLGGGLAERHPVSDTAIGGALTRGGDRRGMEVVAGEHGVRVRLGHNHRRRAMAAADVGDGGARFELGGDTVERRQPRRHQVCLVARPEELLGPSSVPRSP
jgi:hypothetical protein